MQQEPIMPRTIATLAVAAMLACGVSAAAFAGATNSAHIDTSGVNMQPAYPATALPNRESGAVVVGVHVGDDGKVRHVDLVKSSGFEDLDSAAMNAARGWHYTPAMDNGSSVNGTVNVQIVFQPPA